MEENKMNLKTWDWYMRQGKIDGYRNYIGECDHKDMFLIVSQTRDSGSRQKRKFASILRILGGESEDVKLLHCSHWAVGWVDHILINPENEKLVKNAYRYCDQNCLTTT